MAFGDDLAVGGTLLFFVIFVLGVVSLQLCLDACYRRRDMAAAASSSQSARWRRGGGDPEALPSPTVTVYRTVARSNKEEEAASVQCAVCLAGIEDGEEARFMPCCGHGFHAQCVGTWLAMAARPTCPLCRIAVARPSCGAPAPAPASGLPPVPSEPANYSANLPAVASPTRAHTEC
ncbi:unnamed protein product [Urochloa decumbens]|uniref:RING-type E3 ubiquitin transferase n=1 Tax=Urochloa decumbens TaxID=240449 RepID=A0ABC9CJX2_9POAL